MPGSFSKNTGFGLTQMLVVAAIISVLMAMLVPTLSHLRAGARNAQCISHMRQIGMALNSYASDNGNRYPKIHNKKYSEPIWMSKAAPYAGMGDNAVGNAPLPRSAGIFVCPEFPKSAWEARETSYRYNGKVVSVWKYDRAAMGPNIFIVVETEGINTDEFPHPDERDVARRHPGKSANFLYTGGHVENIREYVPFDDPRWGDTLNTP